VERALVALSSPVGVEGLPAAEALAAVGAWHEAGAALPEPLGFWAAVPTRLPVADQVALFGEGLALGAAGLCLPASRLGCPRSAEGALELLAAVGAAGVPVFVHPGPAGEDPAVPSWWSPSTGYVAQMHAAWHAVHARVRPALPNLRVVFALLAGLAPLHAERTARRGGLGAADPLDDPRSFYDTSSYGPRAIRAMAEAVGTGQLVHGSDHPVVAPAQDAVALALGGEAAEVVRRDGPARALGHEWVPA
jgi:predicted TIM-barrel fold metal-dependent hydrolase